MLTEAEPRPDRTQPKIPYRTELNQSDRTGPNSTQLNLSDRTELTLTYRTELNLSDRIEQSSTQPIRPDRTYPNIADRTELTISNRAELSLSIDRLGILGYSRFDMLG